MRAKSQLRPEAATVMARKARSNVPEVEFAESERPDMSWGLLFRAGGIAALLYVLLLVAPVPPTEGRALLAYVAAHKIVYLSELVCFVGLSVPALVQPDRSDGQDAATKPMLSTDPWLVMHSTESLAAIGRVAGFTGRRMRL
jgi:hypothetical protein